MSGQLRERVGRRRTGAGQRAAPNAPAVMARSLAAILAAAGAVALAALALPQPATQSAIGTLSAALALLAAAAVVAGGSDRIPMWGFKALLACASLLISAVIHLSGDSASSYAFLYVGVVLYAFYFLRRGDALVQAALLALLYGTTLALLDPSSLALTRWATTIGALTAAGALVATLKERVDALIADLDRAARTDTLTGLANRRAFDESLRFEVERARRVGRPLALVMGDLDRFKQVNDRFGHPAGDRVLARVGGVLRSATRRIDTAARVGGEEFGLILPETGSDGGLVLAERVRARVADELAVDPGAVTISLGVASFPADGERPDALMECADRALYRAKRIGRNRSEAHTTELDAIGPSDPPGTAPEPLASGAPVEAPMASAGVASPRAEPKPAA